MIFQGPNVLHLISQYLHVDCQNQGILGYKPSGTADVNHSGKLT